MRMRISAVAVAVLAVAVWPATATHTAAAFGCTPTATIRNAATTDENAGPMTFDVDVSAPVGCPVKGKFAFYVDDDPAKEPVAGSDYDMAPGAMNVDSVQPLTLQIKVTVIADTVHPENDEEVKMCLTPLTLITVSGCATGMIHSTPWCARAETGQSASCSIPVDLSAPQRDPVVVDYLTADDTAVAGEDYVGVTNGRVTVPAGETRGVLNVEILSGRPADPDERFTVAYLATGGAGTESGRISVTVGR